MNRVALTPTQAAFIRERISWWLRSRPPLRLTLRHRSRASSFLVMQSGRLDCAGIKARPGDADDNRASRTLALRPRKRDIYQVCQNLPSGSRLLILSGSLSSCFRPSHHVACPAHRMDELRREIPVHFVTQVIHVDIYDICE